MGKVDAIVALGGGISHEGKLTNSSRSRIDMAVALFRQGIAPRIIASGRWSYRLQTNPATTEAAAMRSRAIEQGIEPATIHTEELSRGTIANAYFIKRDILASQDWRRIAVVTCMLHAARAELIFEHILGDGYSVTVYPTLESPDRLSRHQADARLAESANEILDLPRGDDQSLVRRFNYLQKAQVMLPSADLATV